MEIRTAYGADIEVALDITRYYRILWGDVKSKVYGTKPAAVNELRGVIERECA
jgi:hypothetical protein